MISTSITWLIGIGQQFETFYKARDGVCYLLCALPLRGDYGDKTGFRLSAWRNTSGDPPVEDVATLLFSISRSALATSRVKSLLAVEPDLIKRLGLARLKVLVDEGGIEEEVVLTTTSPDADFQVIDPAGDPLLAQKKLRDEILRDLATRHARGERTIRLEAVKDHYCVVPDWLQRALRILDSEGLISGVNFGGLHLTDRGHLAAESIAAQDPAKQTPGRPLVQPADKPMDCFISYAGEDRGVVKNLVAALTHQNVQIWWDKGQITLGDQLSKKIDEGLSLSRYGVVLVSPRFVAKRWTEAELRALHSRAMRSGKKVILPVLFDMTHDEFASTYPLLADLVTTQFSGDIVALAEEIVQVVRQG